MGKRKWNELPQMRCFPEFDELNKSLRILVQNFHYKGLQRMRVSELQLVSACLPAKMLIANIH